MLIPTKNSPSTFTEFAPLLFEDHQTEVLSGERMEMTSKSLANKLVLEKENTKGRSLLPEVILDCSELLESYLLLTREISLLNMTPATEWFLDNFHIIEDQLRSIKRDLPRDFYHELPKIKEGEYAGYPRVYAIAHTVVLIGDARIDVESLKKFVAAFQTVSPLSIGELWAVAITLRIALIKRLLPIVRRILQARLQRRKADELADILLSMMVDNDTHPEAILEKLESILSKKENFHRAFIVQLIGRLRDQDPGIFKVMEWLDKTLDTCGTSTGALTELEHYRQAADQISIGNIINSMRLFSIIDWHDFFESVSLVEPILRKDPADVYALMDIPTRDCYRKEIERLSRYSGKTEIEVAKTILDLSHRYEKFSGQENHVGFYLLGEGLPITESQLGYVSPVKEKIRRFVDRHPALLYFGSIFVLVLYFNALFLGYLTKFENRLFPHILLMALILIPVSELAVGIVNYVTTLLRKPRRLPRMDYKEGLPSHSASMVVVPCMFTSDEVIKELINNIEVQYLANQDENIFFALLGDLRDSPTQVRKEDAEILALVQSEIQILNERYAKGERPRFYAFHRARLLNEAESCWMGWERKRGKILEFNHLMRGAKDTSYLIELPDYEFFKTIKYIITLDADTQLPLQNARRLVGTITHPLNRPIYCPKEKRIIKGYGIIQPRVSVSVVSSSKTRFSQIFSGNTGIDPYTTAVSDVYQDFFGEGTYTGKGLYDLDAFELALEERVPENTVLSHDLFEGSFARVALVTDYELIDEYPSNYETFAKRNHRWTRGDWQIAPWLFPKVKNAKGEWVKNNLPLVAKWKILDNLRRSLMAPLILIWMTLGWTILPGSALFWTAAVIFTMSLPVWAPSLQDLVKGKNIPWPEHLNAAFRSIRSRIEQVFMMVVYLPNMAWNNTDAIFRSLYRMFFSHRHMLEWVTFSQTQKETKTSYTWKEFVSHSTFMAIFTTGLILIVRPDSIFFAMPFILSWAIAPYISHETKKTLPGNLTALTSEEKKAFRRFARMTWHFFETFANEKENWLAPDNFQEDPRPVIAHRTSPTNIGLQLLANLSAYDFGYLGLVDFVEKTENTLATVAKLEKHQGHLYNWYDTLSLAPLHPKYISTVDSGNLAGHLITLKQACLTLAQGDFINKNVQQGLSDTFIVIDELLHKLQSLSKLQKSGSLKRLTQNLDHVKKNIGIMSWEELKKNHQISKKLLGDLVFEQRPHLCIKIEEWMDTLLNQINSYERDSMTELPRLRTRLKTIAYQAHDLAHTMDFKFLFDDQRKVFAIGFNASENRRDDSYYDLLASESRLTSFFAISKGDVSDEHWFRLGRGLTNVVGSRCLISWSATMFEYLMPLLVMKRYDGTLLDQTYDSVVNRQIEYGNQRQIPWGVSEAGYNARDLQFNYQYGPFGIPGLGLKRGLRDELVISPYSTMLAAMVHPREALRNLNILESQDALGHFGFYESIDYTSERVPKNRKNVTLHSYMAHHQGMSLLSVNNLLNNFIMQERFHNDARTQAVALLLQEKIPATLETLKPRAEETHVESYSRFSENHHVRSYVDAHLSTPRTQVLSNGRYTLMLSSSGGGFSKMEDRLVSRWREDSTLDNYGQFIFVRNQEQNKLWSTAPRARDPKPLKFESHFAEDKIELIREDLDTIMTTEVIVSSEDNVEMRRVTLTNKTNTDMVLDVTSFMEIALARLQDDVAHPAFSNLFIQTEYLQEHDALLAMRRPRSSKEKEHWALHTVVVEGEKVGTLEFETDRSRFVGRGQTVFEGRAHTDKTPLSGSVGAVLDPIFSLRRKIRVKARSFVRVTFTTGVAENRQDCLNLVDKYRDPNIFQRETSLGWVKAQIGLRHINVSTEKAHVFQRLGGRILYLAPYLRATSLVMARNNRQQSALWAYGISGDLPIVLTRIHDDKDISLVRELLRGHEYLRLKGIRFDLIILNEHATSYLQTLNEEVMRQILISGAHHLLDRPGGIFVRRADLIPEEDLTLLKTIARLNIFADKGTLEEQLKRRPLDSPLPAAFISTLQKKAWTPSKLTPPELTFKNTFGGFIGNGEEYVIHLQDGITTPAPWINVVANKKDFGFVVSESGSGTTWSVNSRENRLTPWSNDPVSDPPGEAIYIRDEETGSFWSPTPLPVRSKNDTIIRHGQGYTEFETEAEGIYHRLTYFVPENETVKIMQLKLKNKSGRSRKLSIMPFVEWVLGVQRAQSAQTVFTEWDETNQIIFARNTYNNEFSGRTAFFAMSEPVSSFTCDRREFLGRNGSLQKPASLYRGHLSNKHGGAVDPCAALMSVFDLKADEEKEIFILLGQTDAGPEGKNLVIKYRNASKVQDAFRTMKESWDKTLNTIQVKTPDEAMNIIMNRWLVYQTLACRYWARTAFYQSGGAYGFRDQLQDVMALVYSRPELAREQILRAAHRQFPEGDVQHWWHPPTGRGVRTRFSDDLLWLPYVTSFYVKTTGDTKILSEKIPFIETPLLEEGHDETYTEPLTSKQTATLYEHCVRTMDRSLKTGPHGLPLFGSGDWNDGMSRVGNEGRGESVWMAWFLSGVLKNFLPIAKSQNDENRLQVYEKHLEDLKHNIESNAWDGEWYLRAYFDNGSPMGSWGNEECKIDAIAQSWSIISGTGDKERSKLALSKVDEHLINREEGLIKLFTPPFDKSQQDPGYIKGYVPGVRENGGQYTHAAIWTMMAYALSGDSETGVELYSMINPINHADTKEKSEKYKVEPYVIAADIYGVNPHVGRGGWTWYTGSASWYYRAGLETIIGFNLEADHFTLTPRVPESWEKVEMVYRRGETVFNILIINGGKSQALELDEKKVDRIPFLDDGKIHQVKLS